MSFVCVNGFVSSTSSGLNENLVYLVFFWLHSCMTNGETYNIKRFRPKVYSVAANSKINCEHFFPSVAHPHNEMTQLTVFRVQAHAFRQTKRRQQSKRTNNTNANKINFPPTEHNRKKKKTLGDIALPK